MSDAHAYSHPLRRAALAQRKPTRFEVAPGPEERARIAGALGLVDLPAVRLRGEIRPAGRADFALHATLEADVVQPCIVTLAPVLATVREPVTRRYLADWHEPEAEESEVPEDDSIEPLGEAIDLGGLLVEALALALPPYPRAAAAEFGEQTFAAPGTEPLTADKLKPLAGLADLMKKGSGD